MKTVDYINSLIKEREELKDLCKSHVETIYKLNREMCDLKNIILRKDMAIKKFENNLNSNTLYTQTEFENLKNELSILQESYEDLRCKYDTVISETPNVKSKKGKSELSKLRTEYNALKKKYESVVKENEELKSIFDEVERDCGDSN
jgi:hypothetical protein